MEFLTFTQIRVTDRNLYANIDPCVNAEICIEKKFKKSLDFRIYSFTLSDFQDFTCGKYSRTNGGKRVRFAYAFGTCRTLVHGVNSVR